ncbi:hypothetical protein RHGRI_037109 [Rhododendron griersonianum]|uniref:Cytosol aminopeptidase domain-containing protein n=1 Tax=Rhododendron griersonianum TaxID=479676 RepID=A0AAV6HQH5_9ERIC|nr:hypothetical protein RHGRI_037109 [Rhododendron griersonianum]
MEKEPSPTIAHGLGTYRWLKEDITAEPLNIYCNPSSGFIEASIDDAACVLTKFQVNCKVILRSFTGEEVHSITPGKVTLVGYSMGARTTLYMALRCSTKGLELFLDVWYAGELWNSLRVHPHFKKIVASRLQHNDINNLAKVLSDSSTRRQHDKFREKEVMEAMCDSWRSRVSNHISRHNYRSTLSDFEVVVLGGRGWVGYHSGPEARSQNQPLWVLAEEASKIASMYSDVLFATILNADYGGYNIKIGPGCSIELMKFDMGGLAAVLGAAKALGQIKPPGAVVHFIVAASENMISGTGMRPGDIVTTSNGKTIEVGKHGMIIEVTDYNTRRSAMYLPEFSLYPAIKVVSH